MIKKDTSFRNKIFISLMLVTLLFLTFMALIEYYQDSKNFSDQNLKELLKIENSVKETYVYLLNSKKYSPEELKNVLQDRTFELANIFNTNINIYDLDGKLFTSNLKQNGLIKDKIIQELQLTKKRIVKDSLLNDKKFTIFNTYNYILSNKKPVAILNLQHIADNSSTRFQATVLIKQFILIIIFLMILSGFVSWYISKSLTEKIAGIAKKLRDTNVKRNEPIEYSENDEIKPLVSSYNYMLDELKEQTQLLQKNERAEAWKEMARQVAHEINNPLTPLRLTIQNFHRRFRQDDPENSQKVNTLTNSVIHQIDIISAITKSFSDFAKMPVNNDTEIDVVENIRRTIDIFPPSVVSFSSNVTSLNYKIDTLYLTRIITNIIKNGIQAIPDHKEKKIEVNLTEVSDLFTITIADNGSGIPKENLDKVFDKDFTTKSTGMGLGLSMVKKIVEDYNGKIWFETKHDVGTKFFIEFKKN